MRARILLLCLAAGVVPAPAGATHTCALPAAALVADYAALLSANDTFGCHDGTAIGGTSYQVGPDDVAFDLDGADDYVSVPDAPIWDFGASDFRIALTGVVFREPCASSDVFHPDCVLIGHDNGPGSQNKWVVAVTGGQLYVLVDGSVPRTILGVPFSPAVGSAYDLTVERKNGVLAFVINGVRTVPAGSTFFPDANAPLTIGQVEGLGYFNGLIDGVRITRVVP